MKSIQRFAKAAIALGYCYNSRKFAPFHSQKADL
jgi:hypothetical protein